MKPNKSFTMGLLLAGSLLALAAGLNSGCATKLDPAGVYQGNTYLYAADEQMVNAKADLDSFLSWELNNRPVLLSNNLISVCRAANVVRVQAPVWLRAVVAARNSYSNVVYLARPPTDQTSASNALSASLASLAANVVANTQLTNSLNNQ